MYNKIVNKYKYPSKLREIPSPILKKGNKKIKKLGSNQATKQINK